MVSHKPDEGGLPLLLLYDALRCLFWLETKPNVILEGEAFSA